MGSCEFGLCKQSHIMYTLGPSVVSFYRYFKEQIWNSVCHRLPLVQPHSPDFFSINHRPSRLQDEKPFSISCPFDIVYSVQDVLAQRLLPQHCEVPVCALDFRGGREAVAIALLVVM